jgi:hypothetical protein
MNTSSIANIDISATDQSVVLRMRHAVDGHPGAILAFSEVDAMVDRLRQVRDQAVARATWAPNLDGLLG